MAGVTAEVDGAVGASASAAWSCPLCPLLEREVRDEVAMWAPPVSTRQPGPRFKWKQVYPVDAFPQGRHTSDNARLMWLLHVHSWANGPDRSLPRADVLCFSLGHTHLDVYFFLFFF